MIDKLTKNLNKLSNLDDVCIERWCDNTINSININKIDGCDGYLVGLYISNLPKTCKIIKTIKKRSNSNVVIDKQDLTILDNSIALENSNSNIVKIVESNWKLYER